MGAREQTGQIAVTEEDDQVEVYTAAPENAPRVAAGAGDSGRQDDLEDDGDDSA
jgi:hypothetical protein